MKITTVMTTCLLAIAGSTICFGDSKPNDILGIWQSRRPYWNDEIEFHPQGRVIGKFADSKWHRSISVSGKWTKNRKKNESSFPEISLEFEQSFAPVSAKLAIRDGKEVLEVIYLHDGTHSILVYYKKSEKDNQSNNFRDLVDDGIRIYPTGHGPKKGNEKRVIVIGAVRHQGIYYLEEDWNLTDFIQFCGVHQPWSGVRRTRLRRMIQGEEKIMIIDLSHKKASEIKIEDGDIFNIPYIPW